MTESVFNRLAAEGYNRIPVTLETFADLDTPLSIYLKLAQGPYTYLLESVQGGERFGSRVLVPPRRRRDGIEKGFDCRDARRLERRRAAAERVQVRRKHQVPGARETLGKVLDVLVDTPDLLDEHDGRQGCAGRLRRAAVRAERRVTRPDPDPLAGKLHQYTVTSVPMGSYLYTTAAEEKESSTQPRLCGEP